MDYNATIWKPNTKLIPSYCVNLSRGIQRLKGCLAPTIATLVLCLATLTTLTPLAEASPQHDLTCGDLFDAFLSNELPPHVRIDDPDLRSCLQNRDSCPEDLLAALCKDLEDQVRGPPKTRPADPPFVEPYKDPLVGLIEGPWGDAWVSCLDTAEDLTDVAVIDPTGAASLCRLCINIAQCDQNGAMQACVDLVLDWGIGGASLLRWKEEMLIQFLAGGACQKYLPEEH